MHHDLSSLDRRLLLGAAGLAGLAAIGTRGAHAGPLNPPTGPIASTTKPLSEVEPRIAINAANTPGDADSLFKITQPGSYYLTGNITGVAGKHGIKVEAPSSGSGATSNGVVIDLNGFSLIGLPGSLSGVSASVDISGPANFSILNGTVRSWGQSGVYAPYAHNARVSLLNLNLNGQHGLLVGDQSRITDCIAVGNALNGVASGRSSLLTGCSASNNGNHGITTGEPIGASDLGASLSNCVAHANGGDGFHLSSGAAITSCAASANGVNGFYSGSSSTYASCTSQRNVQDGFIVSSGSVLNSTAMYNGRYGINAASSCLIRACSVGGSFSDNIRVFNTCHVVDNFCNGGGNGLTAPGDGANIHALNQRNHIEGNYCINGDRGIQVDGVLNTIIRNICVAGGGHYTIGVNNFYGPIVSNIDVATPGVANTPSPGTMGSTDPNANFMC